MSKVTPFLMFSDRLDEAIAFYTSTFPDYGGDIVAAGGVPSRCGWITDPFGLSWQIVPRRFTEMLRDGDPVKVKAVVEAMMTMGKLDLARLEEAYLGA